MFILFNIRTVLQLKVVLEHYLVRKVSFNVDKDLFFCYIALRTTFDLSYLVIFCKLYQMQFFNSFTRYVNMTIIESLYNPVFDA